jgi:plasmid maintenance system killer protein
MDKKMALLKASDIGPMGRGQAGKKKVYEIQVSGRIVTFSWGMAEKVQRKTQTIVCASNQAALAMASNKKWEKLSSGYALAYEV